MLISSPFDFQYVTLGCPSRVNVVPESCVAQTTKSMKRIQSDVLRPAFLSLFCISLAIALRSSHIDETILDHLKALSRLH